LKAGTYGWDVVIVTSTTTEDGYDILCHHSSS